MCQSFAPTQFNISMEGDYFTKEGVIQRDDRGMVTKISLPSKLVIMSNHQVGRRPQQLNIPPSTHLNIQVYLDWWYLGCFTYWTGHSKDIIIVLKRSLKWVPILGWVS